MSGASGLAFLRGTPPLDYGRRLGRLRWRRAVRAGEVREVGRSDLARGAFAPAARWTVVLDENALPICPDGAPEPGRRVVIAWSRSAADPPFVHTLRELEEAASASVRAGPLPSLEAASAIVFDTAVFAPEPMETVERFLARLRSSDSVAVEAGFAVLPSPAAFGPRREVTRHLPGTARRLLDVGCGNGEASASLKAASPQLVVWGVERDPALAAIAASRLDRVLSGEAPRILERLAGETERFDAFLFADVLEHLDDPIGALAQARSLAQAGATLVASVPNVGHLSVVRDLLLGRFDPVPSGLLDSGHLRWFTRRSLLDALEASAWSVESVEAAGGAPAPDAEDFLRWAERFPGVDGSGLRAYQWIAVARAKEDSAR